jgi:hypothetical protein
MNNMINTKPANVTRIYSNKHTLNGANTSRGMERTIQLADNKTKGKLHKMGNSSFRWIINSYNELAQVTITPQGMNIPKNRWQWIQWRDTTDGYQPERDKLERKVSLSIYRLCTGHCTLPAPEETWRSTQLLFANVGSATKHILQTCPIMTSRQHSLKTNLWRTANFAEHHGLRI